MTDTSPVLSQRSGLQAMPAVAMLLVVMLLGVLLWLLHRNELEEERFSLIKDILWVEQNIHFHLTSDEEKLGQLALEMGRGELSPEALETQLRSLVATNPEIDRIILRDADGGLGVVMPPMKGEVPVLEPGEAAPWWGAFALARSIGRVAWSQPFVIPGRGAVFEAHVPVHSQGRFVGMVVAQFTVDSLLTHHVPWWVAEKYKIELLDSAGAVLGAKTAVEVAEAGLTHQVRLEPPGQGVAVAATVYRNETNLARNLLATAIFSLALLAVSSLLALRRHVHRRLVAEQALREEHSFRKAMEDSLTVGMRARDLDGRITYVNPAFCQMVGWSERELVGAVPPMPYWLPEAMDSTMEMHRRVLAGDAPRDGFEIQFRRRNGETFWALIYEAPLIDADNRHTGWMASVVDITERKRAEELARLQQEKLQHTGRLITMGEMASTLAHELNQPLSAIASYNTGCLNLLDAGAMDPVDLRKAMEKLGIQAQRAGQIIRRVHDFVRKSEPQLGPCDLNQVLENIVGFLEFDAKRRGVVIDLRPAPFPVWVDGDRILLEQVLLNLARNGIEAMEGTVTEARILSLRLEIRDDRAECSVADNGSGIPPEAEGSLFQPFFTTKPDGMGMGLNICRSIIELHRGRLWVEPAAGGGSVFLFSLPLRGA